MNSQIVFFVPGQVNITCRYRFLMFHVLLNIAIHCIQVFLSYEGKIFIYVNTVHADRKNKTNKLQQAQLTEFSKNIKIPGLHILKVAHTKRFVVLYLCYMLIGAHRRNLNVLVFSWKQKNLIMGCGNCFFYKQSGTSNIYTKYLKSQIPGILFLM